MDEDLKPLNLDEGIDAAAEDVVDDAPRIGWGEILLVTPLLLFVDFMELMGAFLEAIPVAGQFVLLPVSLMFSAVSLMVTFFVQFYFFIKKIKNFTFLITSLADSVPVLSALPLRTAGWLVTVFLTNNKKFSKAVTATPVGKAAEIAGQL